MTQGLALVADDNGVIRYMLTQQLAQLGVKVIAVSNGIEALAQLNEQPCDVLLLDVMMPGLDGHGVLRELKANPRLKEIPVIMISGVDETRVAAQCIEAGAEDYLTKPIDTVLLHARVRALLERKRLREAERRYYQAMLESQRALRDELEAAASYARSLLPAPITGDLAIDWRFIPSAQLGGDAFGYHWLDRDRLALYLLDVCGHGFKATLLATSVLNVLRAQTLAVTDFTDPGAVLAALSDAFLIERHAGTYFTLWYGVHDRSKGLLRYASACHPPAILLRGAGREPVELETTNPLLGAEPGLRFESAETPVAVGDSLYVFSDGAFEVAEADGQMASFASFLENLRQPGSPTEALDRCLQFVAQRTQSDSLNDDFSMVRVDFRR
jgi:sigma-B regulation protein RsbU (phosphoserine phosphatase)